MLNIFRECSGLTSVTIANSVTSIGESAFYNCSHLTSVIIPNSVISIGRSAFENCLLLTSVTIPNSITTIEERTFNWCQHLTSVTIPSSVTSIGEGAFGNCYGLTSVYISDIAVWCNIEFYNSSSNPLGAAHNLYLNGQEVKDLVIPNSVTSIGNYAFYGCSGLTSVTIPNSVTSIGEFAFSDCSGLTSVIIPNSVTSIGACAFSGCSGLTSVTIPNGVTSIEYATFKNCSSLTSVTIGNSVSSIGQDAFYGCRGMTSLTIPDGITSIVSGAFKYCTNLTSVNVKVSDYSTFINNNIGNLVKREIGKPVVLMDESGNEIKIIIIPNDITAIGDNAFYNCSGLTSVTIPNSVTSIGYSAFSNCSGLTSVTIPNSVTSIADYAFEHCSGLTSVTIPSSVTSIGNYDFYGCSGLTSVTIPNSVTSIGDYAFMDCSGLTSVTIGSGVTSFGSKAFYSENIVTVNSLFEEPSAIEGKSSSSSVFHGDTYVYGKLKVPFGTKDKYKATKGWRDFDTIEEGVDVEIPGAEKCATPTISYNKGELTFSCDTEGATCKYTITDADVQSGSGNKVQLSVAYQVSVVAMKEGYNNSETAEATLCWVDVQPQTEGVEVATALQSIEAQPVLIQANGQVVSITGAPEGSAIAIYDTSGQLVGSGKATAGTTDISTQLCNGGIAIVKIGDRAVKVVVK